MLTKEVLVLVGTCGVVRAVKVVLNVLHPETFEYLLVIQYMRQFSFRPVVSKAYLVSVTSARLRVVAHFLEDAVHSEA